MPNRWRDTSLSILSTSNRWCCACSAGNGGVCSMARQLLKRDGPFSSSNVAITGMSQLSLSRLRSWSQRLSRYAGTGLSSCVPPRTRRCTRGACQCGGVYSVGAGVQARGVGARRGWRTVIVNAATRVSAALNTGCSGLPPVLVEDSGSDSCCEICPV